MPCHDHFRGEEEEKGETCEPVSRLGVSVQKYEMLPVSTVATLLEEAASQARRPVNLSFGQ
jgi:hypothetical protein